MLNLYLHLFCAADGKPENAFAFSGEAKNKKYATEIIHECHEAWRRLITGEVPAQTNSYDLSIANVTVQGSPGHVPPDHPIYTNIPKATRDPPKPIDASSESLVPFALSMCSPVTTKRWLLRHGYREVALTFAIYPFTLRTTTQPSSILSSPTDKNYLFLSPSLQVVLHLLCSGLNKKKHMRSAEGIHRPSFRRCRYPVCRDRENEGIHLSRHMSAPEVKSYPRFPELSSQSCYRLEPAEYVGYCDYLPHGGFVSGNSHNWPYLLATIFLYS